MSNSWSLSARWIFPVDAPPLPDGVIVIRGDRIEAVEPAGRTADVDLGNVAIIPGLVNAHTHLDLTGALGRTPPTPADRFPDWLRSVIDFRRTRSPDEIDVDIRTGLDECLRFGTTLVGDIASEGRSWNALATTSLRAVVFRETLGLSEERTAQEVNATQRWLQETTPSSTCRAGLSPHAPYSTSIRLFLAAIVAGVPVATHVAESAAEGELLEHRAGPFVEFLRNLGVYDPHSISRRLTEFADLAQFARAKLEDSGKKPQPVLLVHGNHLPRDIAIDDPGISIVYCPRTHAAFGHPPHPFREFLANGIRVCLGTDSLASNPDLDLLAEARFVHHRHPDFPGDALLRMATLAGAEALGWDEDTGSITPTKSADLVAVPLPNRDVRDPHELLFAANSPRRTLFRGEWRDSSQ